MFAPVYASLFSGFYLAFMLVLLVMILRTVAIEFRSKRPSHRWRQAWDWVFSIASLGLALLLGVAFGNIIAGVDLAQDGEVDESLIDLLNPYALLIGVTAVAMFAMHGALFLNLKTEGELQHRVRRAIPILMGVFFVLVTVGVISTAIWEEEVSDRFLDDIWPGIFPATALLAWIAVGYLLRRGDDLWAFVASGSMIALLLISGAVGMFPNLLISSTNEDYNLTVDNSASADNTLTDLPHRCGDWYAFDPHIYGRRLLFLPRKDGPGAGQLLAVGPVSGAARRMSEKSTSIDRRIVGYSGRARIFLYLTVACGFLATVIVVAQAWLLSDVVSRVFLDGDNVSGVSLLLLGMLALAFGRAAALWSGDVLAQRSASHLKHQLRTDLTRHIFNLGPVFTRRASSGELVNTAVQGVEDLDEYMTAYQPLRFLTILVPLFVAL